MDNEKEVECSCDKKAENKLRYVESIKIGTIVAFKTHDEQKAKSAKVINISRNKRKLKVCTEYGVEIIIGYDDVIWVKTSERWPKGVYNLLKGLGSENERK